uniref:Uncharacterized protein n=1 Tax=viral metagenome TaxID=1070528 RepID=A0A6M3JJ88_9ZZZZ
MKTIKELEALDRKIMEQDYYDSYRRPSILVKLIWLGLSLFIGVCSMLFIYGFVYTIYNVIKSLWYQ